MSAENGHLVALSAALYHSVPAHVHELRGRVSQLAEDNSHLMIYAYQQAMAQKLTVYEQQHNAVWQIIGYAKDQHEARRWMMFFIEAGRFYDSRRGPLEREIDAQVNRSIEMHIPGNLPNIRLRRDLPAHLYQAEINDLVWQKKFEDILGLGHVVTVTGWQRMPNGTVQKLGTWKSQKVRGDLQTKVIKVRRTLKSKAVHPRVSFVQTDLWSLW